MNYVLRALSGGTCSKSTKVSDILPIHNDTTNFALYFVVYGFYKIGKSALWIDVIFSQNLFEQVSFYNISQKQSTHGFNPPELADL